MAANPTITPSIITFPCECVRIVQESLQETLRMGCLEFQALEVVSLHPEGCGPTLVSQRADVSKGAAAQALDSLSERSFIRKYDGHSPHGRYVMTDSGSVALRQADLLLVDLFAQVTEGLDTGYANVLLTGSIIEAFHKGGYRLSGGLFFSEGAFFGQCFHTKASFMKCAHELDVSFTEMRILVELSSVIDPISLGDLAYRLILHPSTVTAAFKKLERSGDLEVSRRRGDHRSRVVALSEQGRERANRVLKRVSAIHFGELRDTTGEERSLYFIITEQAVGNLRRRRTAGK